MSVAKRVSEEMDV
jgi:pre-mRNA-splicing factor ATP-dependent RNA helicase DHX15/PRP43